MGNEYGELALEVKTLPDTDPEELAELVHRLRAELLDLDVDAVQPISLIFNLPPSVLWRCAGCTACRPDMVRPPLDPLRVPLTELEDESDGRDAQCGVCPGRGVG
jgi:hypothetical protein